uniref:Odorant receptor n=1 Tax=Culicoides sonorensis TaxID=179676 RepID=A0A336M597_CULSO
MTFEQIIYVCMCLENSFDGCFKYNDIFLNIFGINIFDDKYYSRYYAHNLRFFLFALSLVISTFSAFWCAFEKFKDSLEDQLSALVAGFFALMIDLKLIGLLYKYEGCRKIKHHILQKTKHNYDPAYQPIMLKYQRFARTTVKVLTVVYFLAPINMNLYPFMSSKSRLYPLNFAIPGVPDETLYGYIINFVYIGCCCFIASTFFLTFDSFFMPLSFYLASRFELCAHYFNQIGENEKADSNSVKSFINIGIALHAETLEIFKMCQDFMEPIILVEAGGIGFLISVQMFLLLVNPLNPAILSFFGSVTQVFLYCVVGELIAYKAFDVSMQLYCSKWYNLKDNRLKKMLIVVLNRTQEPCYYCLGNLLPFGMITFGNIVGISYKAFNLLTSTMK